MLAACKCSPRRSREEEARLSPTEHARGTLRADETLQRVRIQLAKEQRAGRVGLVPLRSSELLQQLRVKVRVRGRRVHGEVARAAQLMAPEKVRTLRVEQQGYLWGSAGAVMSSLLASSAMVGTRRGGHAPSSESEERGYLWLLEQRGYLSLLESEGTSH